MVLELMDKINTEDTLIVPQDAMLRNRLRSEVRKLIATHPVQPPVEFTALKLMAENLLAKLGVDKGYLNFAIVLLGNETWREVVAATPYNRRLLLLPQCLRKTESCKGEMDVLGLICAGCKACNIEGLLNEAELLGYTCLVAEGTTVAVGLVEEGAIDAVIGVTCMDVLKRSYEKVSQAAVPVLGIPLLNNGCDNTRADEQWLKQELHQLNRTGLNRPISVSELKEKIHDLFTRNEVKSYFPFNDPTAQKALSMLNLGGQRMRPLIAVLAYQAYAPVIDEETEIFLSLIIECFHKASLIHDDIEDDDDFRYNHKTLHKSHGVPVAINVGDYLIGKGYQLLAALKIDPASKANALTVVAASHVTLSSGQGADLDLKNHLFETSLDDLERIYVKKTGEAIKVALLLGAIAGGAAQSELKYLTTFADHFGIAYQIRDDLNEFEETGVKDDISDFAYLAALLADNNKRKRGEPVNGLTIEDMIKEVHQQDIVKIASAALKKHVGACREQLGLLENLPLKLALYRVMAKIFNA